MSNVTDTTWLEEWAARTHVSRGESIYHDLAQQIEDNDDKPITITIGVVYPFTRYVQVRKVDIDQSVVVKLHNTDIITIHEDGVVEIRTEGYTTAETRLAFDTILGRGIVFGHDCYWWCRSAPFRDGIVLDGDLVVREPGHGPHLRSSDPRIVSYPAEPSLNVRRSRKRVNRWGEPVHPAHATKAQTADAERS